MLVLWKYAMASMVTTSIILRADWVFEKKEEELKPTSTCLFIQILDGAKGGKQGLKQGKNTEEGRKNKQKEQVERKKKPKKNSPRNHYYNNRQ